MSEAPTVLGTATATPVAADGGIRTAARIGTGLDGAKADDWLKRNDVRVPNALERIVGCEEVSVGTPGRSALWCLRTAGPMSGSFSSGESVFPLRVYVAHGHALRTVLELPIAAGPLDRDFIDPADPREGNYVVLEAELAPDGNAITVREPSLPGTTCAAALAELAQPIFAKHRKMVQRACHSIGTYVWQGNAFVRGTKPASGPTPLPTGTAANGR